MYGCFARRHSHIHYLTAVGENVTGAVADTEHIAEAHGCKSIAFPLISAGTHGFPKDQVMQIALKAIGDFLLKHEIMVYLVIYDRDTYSLEGKLSSRVRDYIHRRYRSEAYLLSCLPAEEDTLSEYCLRSESPTISKASRRKPIAPSSATYSACAAPCATECDDSHERFRPRAKVPSCSLDDYIKLDKKFAYKLADLIAEKGMTSVECYKKANVDKKTFSKIKCNPDTYKPSKQTAVAFAIALELSVEETGELLASAGLALSRSFTFDKIIMFFLEKEIYDIFEINEALFEFDQMLLGC